LNQHTETSLVPKENTATKAIHSRVCPGTTKEIAYIKGHRTT
jgi:hypothetical protein